MKLKIIIIISAVSSLFFTACQKDIDVFIPDPGQVNGIDSNWVTSISSSMPVSKLREALAIAPHIDSFNNNNPLPVSAISTGMNCFFSPNSCVNTAGVAVNGNVQTEMMLLKKKGDLIRMNKPTQSNGRMLVTGGVVYLKVKQDNSALSLAPTSTVYIKFADAAPNPAMKYFLGDASNPNEFNWIQPADSQRNRVLMTSQEYNILTGNLNWINCDYFYDTTGINRVTVTAQLPSNYTNANTEVFLSFKEIRSVLGMYGSPATKKFSTQKIPAGKPAYIVVLSKQGNDYFFAHEAVITGATNVGGDQLVKLTPVKATLTEIKAWLDTL